jgi:hypothetical protein
MKIINRERAKNVKRINREDAIKTFAPLRLGGKRAFAP